jgi:hypothetical protein
MRYQVAYDHAQVVVADRFVFSHVEALPTKESPAFAVDDRNRTAGQGDLQAPRLALRLVVVSLDPPGRRRQRRDGAINELRRATALKLDKPTCTMNSPATDLLFSMSRNYKRAMRRLRRERKTAG